MRSQYIFSMPFQNHLRIRDFRLPVLLLLLGWACQSPTVEYVCPPCDLSCDTLVFQGPGICPHCQMPLIPAHEVFDLSELPLNEVKLEEGPGVFLVEGGKGRREKAIPVYYYRPKTFSPQSRILLVLPGAGRDGDEYRDSWKEIAEKKDLLVLSPVYREEMYPFTDYHLGGLVQSPDLMQAVRFEENSNRAHLDEEAFSYSWNSEPADWIFPDFDRLFERVVEATGSAQTEYDLFGHSAGGQILHRLVLFYPDSKARYILAANSGFYTIPEPEIQFPFGLKGAPISPADRRKAFQKRLILLLGQQDNAEETKGTLLRSPTADQHGLHRLARGRYFFEKSREIASSMDADFHWEKIEVPGVGHDQEKMAQAAATFLFPTKTRNPGY